MKNGFKFAAAAGASLALLFVLNGCHRIEDTGTDEPIVVPIEDIQETPTNTLSGTVADVEGNPIENATVQLSIEGGNATISNPTGEDGVYTLNDVKAGTYQVEVKASGYATLADEIEIVNKMVDGKQQTQNIGQNFTLQVKMEEQSAVETSSKDDLLEKVSAEGSELSEEEQERAKAVLEESGEELASNLNALTGAAKTDEEKQADENRTEEEKTAAVKETAKAAEEAVKVLEQLPEATPIYNVTVPQATIVEESEDESAVESSGETTTTTDETDTELTTETTTVVVPAEAKVEVQVEVQAGAYKEILQSLASATTEAGAEGATVKADDIFDDGATELKISVEAAQDGEVTVDAATKALGNGRHGARLLGNTLNCNLKKKPEKLGSPIDLFFKMDKDIADAVRVFRKAGNTWEAVVAKAAKADSETEYYEYSEKKGGIVVHAVRFVQYAIFLDIEVSIQAGTPETLKFTPSSWSSESVSNTRPERSTYVYKIGGKITSGASFNGNKDMLRALLLERFIGSFDRTAYSVRGYYTPKEIPAWTRVNIQGTQPTSTVTIKAVGIDDVSIVGTQYGETSISVSSTTRDHTGGGSN